MEHIVIDRAGQAKVRVPGAKNRNFHNWGQELQRLRGVIYKQHIENSPAYKKAWDDAQAGGMSADESHEFAMDHASRRAAKSIGGFSCALNAGHAGPCQQQREGLSYAASAPSLDR